MEPTVYISPTPWYKRKLVWIFLLILILIPVGSYLYANYFRKSPAPPAPAPVASKNTLEEENSPIALDILQNPLVYEWRGSVEGILVAKDEKSITLEKDNQKITISVDLNPDYTGTKFYSNKPTKDLKAPSLKLEDIPIGSYLRGDFFVFNHQKNEMVGSSFTVIEK